MLICSDTLEDEINGMQYVSTTSNFDNTSDANLNAFLFGIRWRYLNDDYFYLSKGNDDDDMGDAMGLLSFKPNADVGLNLKTAL